MSDWFQPIGASRRYHEKSRLYEQCGRRQSILQWLDVDASYPLPVELVPAALDTCVLVAQRCPDLAPTDVSRRCAIPAAAPRQADVSPIP